MVKSEMFINWNCFNKNKILICVVVKIRNKFEYVLLSTIVSFKKNVSFLHAQNVEIYATYLISLFWQYFLLSDFLHMIGVSSEKGRHKCSRFRLGESQVKKEKFLPSLRKEVLH